MVKPKLLSSNSYLLAEQRRLPPLYPAMTDGDVEKVIEAVLKLKG